MGSESRKDGLGSSTMFLRLLLLDDDPSRPPAFPAAAGLVDLVMDQASLANLLRLFTMAPPPSSGSCDENQKVGRTRPVKFGKKFYAGGMGTELQQEWYEILIRGSLHDLNDK